MLTHVKIRDAVSGDAVEISRVITAAFSDGGRVAALWDDIVGRELDRASVVAVENDVIVGHVGVSHAWLDARRELVDVLVLSPLSVRPDRRGQGIGTALIGAAIRASEMLDAPVLFLEGSPDFYATRGFSRAMKLGFSAPSDRIPEPAFQVALLPAYADWMTGRLVYPDVWWQHDAAGLRDPELLEAERRLS